MSASPPAPPVLDRKVSTYSETDSGVDVDNDTEEGLDLGLEKRVIKPDLDIISRLCNFDEEEEMTESDSESSDEKEDCSRERSSSRVSLTLTELRHILSALVKQHTEEELEPSTAHHVLVGKNCSVCSQNIFSMFVYTGSRCEVCSFLVCIHCSRQVSLEASEAEYSLPVSVLTPAGINCGRRQLQSQNFSSLTVSSLDSSLSSLASKMWGRVTRSPSRSPALSICSTCSYVINQAF